MLRFRDFISEDGGAPANSMGAAGTSGLGPASGGIAGFDPVMGGVLRRKVPAMVSAVTNKYRKSRRNGNK